MAVVERVLKSAAPAQFPALFSLQKVKFLTRTPADYTDQFEIVCEDFRYEVVAFYVHRTAPEKYTADFLDKLKDSNRMWFKRFSFQRNFKHLRRSLISLVILQFFITFLR